MGKYDDILPKLPTLSVHPEGTKYQDKINLRRQQILDTVKLTDAAALIKLYAMARAKKTKIESVLSDVQLDLEALGSLIAESYEQFDIKSMAVDIAGTVRVQPEPYAQVQDREAFRLWCLEQGLERSMTLPWQTTNSMTKDLLLKGEAEPPGIKAFKRNKIVFSKDPEAPPSGWTLEDTYFSTDKS